MFDTALATQTCALRSTMDIPSSYGYPSLPRRAIIDQPDGYRLVPGEHTYVVVGYS